MSTGSSPGALAIHLLRADGRELGPAATTSARASSSKGLRLFQDFQAENSLLGPWNPAVAESVAGLEFVAFLRPGTLLVAGTALHLECVRGAAARRLLRPPTGYQIKSIGEVGERERESSASGTRFYPLAEALCSLIAGLNAVGHPATPQSLHGALQRRFHQAATPPLEAVEKSLAWLLSEGRLYCMGSHYFLATPEMFAQFQAQKALIANPTTPWSSSLQRADKGCSREIETQTGESIVMGIPAYKPKHHVASTARPTPTTAQPEAKPHPSKHGGFFRRLFRRSKSREALPRKAETEAKPEAKPASRSSSLSGPSGAVEATPAPVVPISTFTAQFPPTEWLHDPATFRVPKSRRVRDKKEKMGGSVWIDLEPGSVLPPPRRRANDPRVVSGRFPTCPDQLAKHASRHSPKPERRTHRHRLHKYLSSSSEALHPITPRHRHNEDTRKHHRRSQHQPQSRVESPRAPLAAPTATDLDSTIDQASTAPAKSPSKDKVETTGTRVSDSALSSSPVVTEMSSSSSAKFSSWSGSEGRRPDPSYVNLPHDRIQEETGHSGEERLPSPILGERRLERTYENLGLESTHFEELSLEDAAAEEPILAADSSLHALPNYISAL